MFNVRPNLRAPGFNVREPEEEVPGFRLNADGTIGKPPMTAAKLDGNPFDIFEPQPLGAWPPPYLAFARGGGIGGPSCRRTMDSLLSRTPPRRAPDRWTPGQQPAFRSFDAARSDAGQMQLDGRRVQLHDPGRDVFRSFAGAEGIPGDHRAG